MILTASIILAFSSYTYMIIKIKHKKVIARAIEWKDKDRTYPICFILECPYCHEKQWVRKDKLYRNASSALRNNYRCKFCKAGADQPSWIRSREFEKGYNRFNPKNPGWRSI